MKIWYNKVNESRRSVIEAVEPVITIGRDKANTVCLQSPLVSRRHAVVRAANGKLQLENIGLNSCVVGDEEVLGGQSAMFAPGTKVRIWPYSLTFEAEKAVSISRDELESHLRSNMADLELRIHRKLLERLDLYEFEGDRGSDPESIVLLENNIEDVCREMKLFSPENEALLEEITGLTLRDHLVNQLIMETGADQYFDLAALTSNEFDVPATLVPERESEPARPVAVRPPAAESRRVPRHEPAGDAGGERLQRHLPSRPSASAPRAAQVPHLADVEERPEGHDFRLRPAPGPAPRPTVTEIMVVASDQIYVERSGLIERSGRRFISDQVTEAIIERIVAQVGRRIDKSQPLVDARLPDGSRVNAVIPPLAVKGPTLTVRKFPAQRLTMEDLVEMGSVTTAAAMFLRACVIDRHNILVSGGTGTGKTTMLNVLSSFIPFKERIITIEDTTELRLHQEHVVTMETKPANVEGAGEYTIRDLVKNALRMRPDRVIVGECRGPEALDMIQAMNTGHDGSMTTVHANSAREVVERLEVLVLMAADLPVASIDRQVASALDLIVHISRLPGGARVVTQISEVVRYDPEEKQMVVIDIFNLRGGLLRPTGYLPSFVDSLVEKDLLDLQFLYGRDGAKPEAIEP